MVICIIVIAFLCSVFELIVENGHTSGVCFSICRVFPEEMLVIVVALLGLSAIEIPLMMLQVVFVTGPGGRLRDRTMA